MGLWPGINADPPLSLRLRPYRYTPLLTFPYRGAWQPRFESLPSTYDPREFQKKRRFYQSTLIDYPWSQLQDYMFVLGKEPWWFRPPALAQLEPGGNTSTAPGPFFGSYRRILNGAIEIDLDDLWDDSSFYLDPAIQTEAKWVWNGELVTSDNPLPTFVVGTPEVIHRPKYVRPVSLRVGLGMPHLNFRIDKFAAKAFLGVEPVKWKLKLGNYTFLEYVSPRQEWVSIAETQPSRLQRNLEVVGFEGLPQLQPDVSCRHHLGYDAADTTKKVHGPYALGTLIYWSGIVDGVRRYAAAFVGPTSPMFDNRYWGSSGRPQDEIPNGVPVELHEVVVGSNSIPIATGHHSPSTDFGSKIILHLREPVAGLGLPTESGYCLVALQYGPPVIDYFHNAEYLLAINPGSVLAGNWASRDRRHILAGNTFRDQNIITWGAAIFPQSVYDSPNVIVGAWEMNRTMDNVTDNYFVANPGVRTVGTSYPKYFRSGEYSTGDRLGDRTYHPRATGLTKPTELPWPGHCLLAAMAAFAEVGMNGGIEYGEDRFTVVESPRDDTFFPIRESARLALWRLQEDAGKALVGVRSVPATLPGFSVYSLVEMRGETPAIHKLRLLTVDDAGGRATVDPLRFDTIDSATLDRLGGSARGETDEGDSLSTVFGLSYGSGTYIGTTQKAIERMLSDRDFGQHLTKVEDYIQAKYTSKHADVAKALEVASARVPFGYTKSTHIKEVKRNTFTSWETTPDGVPLLARIVKTAGNKAPYYGGYARSWFYDIQFDELVWPPTPIIWVRGYNFAVSPYVSVIIGSLSDPDGATLARQTCTPNWRYPENAGDRFTDTQHGFAPGNAVQGADSNNSGFGLGVGASFLWGVEPPIKRFWNAAQSIYVDSVQDLGATVDVRVIVLKCTISGDPCNPDYAPTEAAITRHDGGTVTHDITGRANPLALGLTVKREVRVITVGNRKLIGSLSRGAFFRYSVTKSSDMALVFEEDTDWHLSPDGFTPFIRKTYGTTRIDGASLGATQNDDGTFTSEALRADGTLEVLQNYYGPSLVGVTSIDGVDPPWS